jgi:hypothetical protein
VGHDPVAEQIAALLNIAAERRKRAQNGLNSGKTPAKVRRRLPTLRA